jgi:pyridoxal 5'-phosphate synthase pdxT subunit
MATIGVLALQGAFIEHVKALRKLGVEAREVRLPSDLNGLDGLIIPGGESTTIARLLQAFDLREPVRDRAMSGLPVWGTCAGMIMLARQTTDLDRPTLDLMDIDVRRNAFGRQIDSFEADLPIAGIDGGPFHAIFIRAPIIERIHEGVEVLASTANGEPVAARENQFLATSFHPELTDDLRLHQYFVEMVESYRDRSREKGNETHRQAVSPS